MHVERLVLDQFRTYEHLDLEIPQQGLRISGRNASGKTSVLEALVMLSTTRSSRAAADRDVVRWESGADYGVKPYARIEALVESRAGHRRVGMSIEIDPDRNAIARRQFLIGSESVRAHDLVGEVKCVLFSPEDVLLVAGAPSERRRQIDILISQIDRAYLKALSTYGKVIAQRNQLLKRFARERRTHRDNGAVTEISFWDDELVRAGAFLMASRRRIANRIAEMVLEKSRTLADGVEMSFQYQPRLPMETFQPGADLAQDRQVLSGLFTDALRQARDEEFRRGMTVVGPHRDDFQFLIGGRDLGAFGSRGQQRLGVVAYRLAEIDIIDQQSGERPILLLDDVLSELDSVHRNLLLTAVAECGCQLLVTSTDASLLEHPMLQELTSAEIREGQFEFGAPETV